MASRDHRPEITHLNVTNLCSFLLVLVLLNLAACKRTARPQALPAPEFKLPQMTGQPLQLSSYRGKVVLLDYWATWCDPCRDEVPHFIDLQNRLGPRGLAIIGVSMDDGPDPVRAFLREHEVNYPIVMGNAKLGEQYGGILGLPIAFVIDRDGNIYSKHIGPVEIARLEEEITNLLRRNPLR